MSNRSAAAIIVIVVVLLFGCPSALFPFNGLFALTEVITSYQVQIIGYGYNAPYWVIGSSCLGSFALLITVLVFFLVLRK